MSQRLKRRRSQEWGDRVRMDLSKLTTVQLLALLEYEYEADAGGAGSEGSGEDG